MLLIDSVTKGYGDQLLLDSTGFQINSGERVGLVGRNGHGKTTLLNMIAGSDHPDDGQIIVPSGYRIGFLSQKIHFTASTILDEAMLGLHEEEREHYWKAEKILAGLGFHPDSFSMHPDQFSGGYQVRLNLAKVLVSGPDLLILDEPTNYLDIVSIRWITGFLNAWKGEILLVTHDRSFMDQVVTHIAGIHRQKIKKIEGNTQKYYLQVAQDEEVFEKTRLNTEKKNKEMALFINRFRAKARLANMVQSRIKTLEKNRAKDKLSELKNLDFKFNHLPFSGRQVVTVNDLTFGWDKQKTLINHLDLTIYPRDCIGVIGKNGKGKTTLLKLLSRQMAPDAGTITYNPGVEGDYFEQTNVQSLNDSFTIEEELLTSFADADRQAARNICGAMMFEKDNALKKISILSGGEKARVMLAKLLMKPLNLLLLDEPSNHLDIESCDAFVSALDQFEGAVALVTHNEMFLHALANRLVVFTENGIDVFDGTYQEFLDKVGWESEAATPGKTGKPAQTKSKKAVRKLKSGIVADKSKEAGPVKKQISQLENKIEQSDDEISRVNDALMQASVDQDGVKIASLSKQLAQLESENQELYEQLELKMEQLDGIEDHYQKLLEQLEKG